ncbi:hypothetical protein [Geminicoccus roseus]|uniref:hypothetical protein n=1 Tax=Geminicoccus roseus TaxID=404900 RepID=UPI000415F6EF|nr:hypothetical protein [Geminicoccus roseus]
MSNFSALADRVEQPQLLGLSEATASSWVGFATDTIHDAVVSAAVLTSAAFRMRDEGALVAALRGLASAVADLELSHANDND